LIEIRCKDGIEIISDESQISLPIIKSFLGRYGFQNTGQGNSFRRSGDIDKQILEQTYEFLKEYFPNISLDQRCEEILYNRKQNENNIEQVRDEALRIKSLVNTPDEIPNITIPRMRDDVSLKWYQKLAVLHATTICNSANFSVPGSGKTWMAYSTYFKFKDEQNLVDKLLVVGPLAAFRPWEREYELITGTEPPIQRIRGNATKRNQIIKRDESEIYLISYGSIIQQETLENLIKLLEKNRFMLIADESHHFKNFLSERATALLQLAPHAKKRMILTGTMMPKELNDLYSQFTFLYPEGEILDDFEQFKFNFPQEDPDSLTNLSQTLSPFFTRISKQALQLPEQTFNPPIVLEMNPIQQRIYDVLADNIRRNDSGYRQDVVLLNEWRRRAIVFLIEAATDPSLLPITNQFTEDISYKTDGMALDELLQNYEGLEGEFPKKFETTLELAQQTINNNGKVIIWCSFIHTINKLAKLFEKQNIHAIQIYGQIPKDDEEDESDNREKRLEKFKTNDDYNVLIANPASLAESVSLHHECHHAIYLDRTFNGGHYMQSLERIHRVGLDPNAVTRYDILQSAMSIDQVISDRLGLKKRRLEEFLNSADLDTMRFQQEDTSKDFANPVGEEGELSEDFDAVLDHINRDVKDF